MKRRQIIRLIVLMLLLAVSYVLLALAQIDPAFNGVDVVAWLLFGFTLYRVASLPRVIGGRR